MTPGASKTLICGSLLLWVLALPFAAGIYPVVSFTEEQIDVVVYPDHVEVSGRYVYRNRFPFAVVQGLSIPLPVDEDQPLPIFVAAWHGTGEEPIPLRYVLGRHRFELRFAAGEEIHLRVDYRQQAPSGTARYILTTTRPWRRPLRRGVYRAFAKGVTLTSSSYPLEADSDGASSFVREDFMPSRDWRLSWEVDS